jgi:isocitrate/isopropylmalate dehydrogenase
MPEIVLLPGDGIGIEIAAAGRRLLDARVAEAADLRSLYP